MDWGLAPTAHTLSTWPLNGTRPVGEEVLSLTSAKRALLFRPPPTVIRSTHAWASLAEDGNGESSKIEVLDTVCWTSNFRANSVFEKKEKLSFSKEGLQRSGTRGPCKLQE